MPREPALLLSVLMVATASCHPDLRNSRCDPFRTPRVLGPSASKAEERSAHAPFIAGDCSACHVADAPASAGEAPLYVRLISPVNEHCVSCHRELFHAAPRGHPPEQSSCTSCHEAHNSRQRSLLRDDDLTRACLDYPPPYPDKPGRVARRRPAGATPAVGIGP